MTILYLTRSYLPEQTGGTLIRKAQVEALEKKGHTVIVVTIGDSDTDEKIRRFAKKGKNSINILAERFGFYEDYLDSWIKYHYKSIHEIAKKCQLVFATSGGELGMIKLGNILKKELKIPLVVNFHDPLDYSIVYGMKMDKKFHVSREKQEKKYLHSVDLIITSSEYYQKALIQKYPDLINIIKNTYFGYIKEQNVIQSKNKGPLVHIIYGGAFSSTQAPDLLAKSFITSTDVEISYIGNWKGYKPVSKLRGKNIRLLHSMKYDDYIKFLYKNADISFISLKGNYFGACIPSKLYEMINLGLPILASLPEGDAKEIINTNGYGIAVGNDTEDIKNAFLQMNNSKVLEQFRTKMINDKDKWSFSKNFEEACEWITTL